MTTPRHLPNGRPVREAVRTCDFSIKRGNLLFCSRCGTFVPDRGEDTPVKECRPHLRRPSPPATAQAARADAKPGPFGDRSSRRRQPRLAALDPPDTDLEYLAELLKPCNCPIARIEHRDLAANAVRRWPVPDVLDNGRFAVGITTAPRSKPTVGSAVRLLNVNGFRPRLFSEPGSPEVTEADYVREPNPARLGAWHNWRRAAEALLDEGKEFVVLLQDDTWLMPGARLFLNRLTMNTDAAFVSLYVARHQARKLERGVAIAEVPIDQDLYWGACGMAFRSDTLRRLLETDVMRTWRGVGNDRKKAARKPHEVRNVDTAITRASRSLKLRTFAIMPSAAQHVAPASSIWGSDDKPRDDSGKRGAAAVVDDWSFGMFKPVGDPDYDRAGRAWARLVGLPAYPLPVGLWHDLRAAVGPGSRVLEFGSGLSTRLLRSLGADVTSIEQDPVIAASSGARHVPLGPDGWYSREGFRAAAPGSPYDCVLVDGPARRSRDGILAVLDGLVRPGGYVLIDDAHRKEENRLATAVAAGFGVPLVMRRADDGRAWGVVKVPD